MNNIQGSKSYLLEADLKEPQNACTKKRGLPEPNGSKTNQSTKDLIDLKLVH